MKRIICALLLTLVLVSLAVAIDPLPVRTIPRATIVMPRIPFATSVVNSGNATASSDVNGKVWIAVAGDRLRGNDETTVTLMSNTVFTTDREGKLEAGVVVNIPATDRIYTANGGSLKMQLSIISIAGPSGPLREGEVSLEGGTYVWKDFNVLATPSGLQYTCSVKSARNSLPGYQYKVRVKIKGASGADGIAALSGAQINTSLGYETPLI